MYKFLFWVSFHCIYFHVKPAFSLLLVLSIFVPSLELYQVLPPPCFPSFPKDIHIPLLVTLKFWTFLGNYLFFNENIYYPYPLHKNKDFLDTLPLLNSNPDNSRYYIEIWLNLSFKV